MGKKKWGGGNFDYGRSSAVDAAGNVYTTGYYYTTADFDPGPATFNLTAVGSDDIFVTKLDAAGNFVWAKSMGGTLNDEAYSIAVDAAGNVYTVGKFSGTADFDPGAGTVNLTSAGNADIFVSKLDAAGNFVWAKSLGGIGGDEGAAIAVDAAANVYTTGFYHNTADFDPGAGTFNLTATANQDIFISKLDAAGNFVWAKSMGWSGDDNGTAITVDAGNVYTTGFFASTVDFDPGAGTSNLTSAGFNDVFVSKLDAAGNFVWARNMGGSDYDNGNGIAVDAAGNVYTTGSYNATADFDPGAATANLTASSVGSSPGSGFDDIFISKLNSAGNFVWAKSMGGTGRDYGTAIAVDGSNVYSVGLFSGTADFDPGAGTNTLAAGGPYLSKLDASGNFVYAYKLGSSSAEIANSSFVRDASGNLYITGNFQNTVDFDPTAGTSNLTATAGTDVFVVKLNDPAALPLTISGIKAFQKSAGVQVEWTVQQESNIHMYVVEKSQNGQQFTRQGTVQAKGNSSTTINYNLFDPAPFAGQNFYRIKTIDKAGKETYSAIMKVNISNSGTSLTVYPNPVQGHTIGLQINNLKKGTYTIALINKLGQQVLYKVIEHAGGSSAESIQPSNTFTPGIYQLRLTGEGIDILQQVLKN